MRTEMAILVSAAIAAVTFWTFWHKQKELKDTSHGGDGGSDPSDSSQSSDGESQPSAGEDTEHPYKERLDALISNFDVWWENDNRSWRGFDPTQPNVKCEKFLPREIKEDCEWADESPPDMCPRIETFLNKHRLSRESLAKMTYGVDYVYALHGSTSLDKVTRSGLETVPGNCGKGVYFALSAGVCRNCYTRGHDTVMYEFTMLKHGCQTLVNGRYGNRLYDAPKFCTKDILNARTGLVIALVLNPRLNPDTGLHYHGGYAETKNWALADEADVLPLKIASVSTEKLIPILWKEYGTSKKAKNTKMFDMFSSGYVLNRFKNFDEPKVKEYFNPTKVEKRKEILLARLARRITRGYRRKR